MEELALVKRNCRRLGRGEECDIFLQVPIRHGYYNILEERIDGRTLLVRESSFLILIHESLMWWPAVGAVLPKVFRPLAEIMQAVRLNWEKGSEDKTVVPIALCAHTITVRSYGCTAVLVPLATFVREAVSYLAEHPTLNLKLLDHFFAEALEKEWLRRLKELEQYSSVSLKKAI
ncbi:MAG: hypothetical protein A3K06_02825 [Candidatus Doudnabacteria bacterium RIFCSPHIGHO2_01_52_17]|uniref:Uncharacterized protein n=1 Tax=Candidatus Doudnabacteria bacterium RIFCSPHIGHO2_01_52_17 TaxID=1817820 RepID=A0A1F5N983_9BACT|nr:MAG: hypothetical protein A3K06_02825 [Candidatus Doudnabacteria bacterium RIFCSPHIGHO2_01_52_17]